MTSMIPPCGHRFLFLEHFFGHFCILNVCNKCNYSLLTVEGVNRNGDCTGGNKLTAVGDDRAMIFQDEVNDYDKNDIGHTLIHFSHPE